MSGFLSYQNSITSPTAVAESGGGSSVDGTEGAGNKRLKLGDGEDQISDLPDSIIHHILSFLPSTKEIIRTGILSKRWLHQWTRVPVLIFNFNHDSWYKSAYRNPDKDFSIFIDSSLVLYDCAKVKKFQLEVVCRSGFYNREIRFAVVKNVEKLILNFHCPGPSYYKLPNFLFNSSSLVQLETWRCYFVSDLKVNFKSLKVLRIHRSRFDDGVIENVLSGSPLLETLELIHCHGLKQLVIASKSLKSLSYRGDGGYFDRLLEIECPKLEKMDLDSLDTVTFRLQVPSLTYVTLGHDPKLGHFYEHSATQLLKKFPHVNELKLVGQFVKAALQVGGLCPPFYIKSLTLVCHPIEMEPLPEVQYALCNSPLLEKLVIELPFRIRNVADLDFEETYRHSNGTGYTCLVTHLKTVQIIGLSKENHKSEYVLQFVGFLLNNARVLEKMVVTLADGGTEFLAEVSQKLLKFPTFSPHCIVEVL